MLALNSDRYLECLFACPWGGFVSCRSTRGWRAPEIEFWLGDSECAALLVDEHFADVAAVLRPKLPHLRRLIFLGEGATPEGMIEYEALIARGRARARRRAPAATISRPCSTPAARPGAPRA